MCTSVQLERQKTATCTSIPQVGWAEKELLFYCCHNKLQKQWLKKFKFILYTSLGHRSDKGLMEQRLRCWQSCLPCWRSWEKIHFLFIWVKFNILPASRNCPYIFWFMIPFHICKASNSRFSLSKDSNFTPLFLHLTFVT